MSAATIQPAAWRVSMGTTEDHNHWHYYSKKPKAIDDGEIWEPLYSASTLESLQRENEELLAENGELRNIVSNCAAALLTGAFVSPKCSVDFMKDVPKEIASTVGSLRQRLDAGPCGEDAIDVAESAAGHLLARAEAAEAEVKLIREAVSELLNQAEHVCLGAHTPLDIKEAARNLADPIGKVQAALASTGGEHNGN